MLLANIFAARIRHIMKNLFAIFFSAAIVATANAQKVPIGTICEEHFSDGDLALVIPQTQELQVRMGSNGPWGFAFAGFETKCDAPLELEVSGSGNFESHDIFSIAALSIDYGGAKGWLERSLFGLGLIGNSREPHPPGWGVGTSGKMVMRGELVSAKPQAVKVKLDLKKYAPADWDGRVWIGLLLHNAGPSKFLNVRIVNGTESTKLSDDEKKKLLEEHEKKFLEAALAELDKKPAGEAPADVVESMKPYAIAQVNETGPRSVSDPIRNTLGNFHRRPPDAQTFLKHAEGFFALQHQAAEHGDVTTALNDFYKNWKDAGEFGKDIGCVIRTATNAEKVGLTDLTTGKIVAAKPEPIRISAARNEHEGFQIALTPLADYHGQVSGVECEFESNRPLLRTTVSPVGYVKIFPGEARQKFVPDPLLADFPALKPGENQAYWVDVYVPPSTPSGEYHGTVRIKDTSLFIPVTLHVRDFEIPKKISLRSSFWLFRDQRNRFYHKKEIDLDDYLKWVDFALEHRVNPIDVWEGACSSLYGIEPEDVAGIGDHVGEGEPNLHPDFTRLDKYIDRMVAGGANTIHLGSTHHFGGLFTDKENPKASPGQVARVEAAVKVLQKHFREKGVYDLHYLQLRDETSEPDSLNVYRAVKKDIPDAKLLLTAMSPAARPLLDIPCPQTPGFDAAWRDEAKAKGGEYWWYVCLSPADPYANLFIFQTAATHRALFWQTWSHNVDGLLYWGLNYWTDYKMTVPDDGKGPTQRVQDDKAVQIGAVLTFPGDGFSMYPGASASQPLSSIRLECMRDGEEDYEYFRMLDALVAKAKPSADLDAARKAIDDAKKLVADMTGYERNGAPYLQIRERIADSIEKLSHP
jgi:hypothetical protein